MDGPFDVKNWEMVIYSWRNQMLLRTQTHTSAAEKVPPTDAGVGWGGGRRPITPPCAIGSVPFEDFLR